MISKKTPEKRNAKPKSGSSSSRMKQLSLLAFLKPAPNNSSPSRCVLNSSPLVKKSKHPDSDKENDTSILDGVPSSDNMRDFTDTPLSSEKDVPVKRAVDFASSPVKLLRKEEELDTEESPISKNLLRSQEPIVGDSTSKSGRKTRGVVYAESDSEDEAPAIRKRRRAVESDDEEEFKPVADEDDDDDDNMNDFIDDGAEASSVNEQSDDEESEDEIKRKRPAKKARASPSRSPQPSKSSTKTGSTTSSIGTKFIATSLYVPSETQKKVPQKARLCSKEKLFEKENEERYQWLVNVRDAEKRTPDDPNYDSRSLYIPSSAWSKFTAFEKQYWEIKGKMWDTVVFFKKGKFYELYENDAIIANTQFDLKIAGGGRANMKLAGIPEMSFEYWAKEFISHGYKVAKVDQKETLLAKEMRGGGSKEEKIIKRELTGILTGGTLTDPNMLSDDMATYCMAIKESVAENGQKIFGVCFVDTATSEVNFIELQDDDECTKLDTLITQIRPKEILCEKNNLCSTAVKIIKFSAHNNHQIWNHLNPYSEFLDYDSALESLVKGKYYPAEDLDDFSNYPEILVKYKDDHCVAFNAFGALLFYLKSLKLENSILSMGNIKEYQISRNVSTHMHLDGITLNNLDILHNNFDGGEKGTLFSLLNRAITAFGKRALKEWVLHPLMNTDEINSRYDAVDFLMNNEPEVRMYLESSLNKLPDLERLIARVHAKNLRFKDFLKVLEGFQTISEIFKKLEKSDLQKSGLLSSLLRKCDPALHDIISSWDDAFDRQQALLNVVVPAEGVDTEFDESMRIISSLEARLDEHLKAYKKLFKSHEICYKDSGKELYLIEVPVKIKSIPKDWQQMAATSKVKRYWSPEVKTLVRELMEQKETHKTVCENLIFRMYERFDINYSEWVSVIKTIGSIDCLLALTRTSETIGYPSCRPQFRTMDSKGFLAFDDLRHPCFVGKTEFIPNDVYLGGDNANFGLLTGANAAGKSTLMRTTALAVIMSQIGCYVLASKAELSPVDKIMTRLGANDNIIQGKSTFYVELSETKKILSNATANSLVILDELGRGGSSSDGYAIAEAVLHHLATHVHPLGFFATHYGSLGLSFVNHPRISPLRMAILVDGNSRNITFLYKAEPGTAPGSFGMNVAAMCGISSDIVNQAETAANYYEQTSKLREEHAKQKANSLSLGLQSDFSWFYGKSDKIEQGILRYGEEEKRESLKNVFKIIESL